MDTPDLPKNPAPIIELKDYIREQDRSTERYEELTDSEFAALVLSMWAHPARSDKATLEAVAAGSIGRHSLQDRLDVLLTTCIEQDFSLDENDILIPHFAHTEAVVAGDDMQERATAHTKIVYAVSETRFNPQHRQKQVLSVLTRIIHAYDDPNELHDTNRPYPV